MLRPIRFFLFLLVAVSGLQAQAIGEIERVIGWGLNAVSYGTVLAEIENQKSRIQAHYAVKRAEIAQSIEIEKNARMKEMIKLEMAQTKDRLRGLQLLLEKSEASHRELLTLNRLFEQMRAEQAVGHGKLQVFLETLRQELDLNEISLSDLKALQDQCTLAATQKKIFLPSCALLQMLTAEDSSKVDPLGHSPMDKIAQKLRSARLEGLRIESRIKIELDGQAIYLRAVEKRLPELQ